MGSDGTQYGKLLEDLENDFTQGGDNYLATLQQAYSLLIYWKQAAQNLLQLIGLVNDGVAFTSIGSEDTGHASGSDGGTGRSGHQQQRCYNCNQIGHIAWDCPD